MPKVSVVIATYNRGHFICGAIESAFAQTFKDFEVIVVDDGSSDNTKEELEKYASRIHYIFQENKGRAEARNTAIMAAKGEYVAFLDDDDIWLPHKLGRQVAFLDSNPDIGLVHAFVEMIDEGGCLLQKETNKWRKLYMKAMKIGYTYEGMSRFCVMFLSTVMVRRNCIGQVGLFDSGIRAFEDWDVYLRIALKYRIGTIRQPLVRHRLHRTHTTMPEFIQGQIKVSMKHLAIADSSCGLALRNRIRHNFYIRLGNAYYTDTQLAMFRYYVLKALKLNPLILFFPRLILHFFLSLMPVRMVQVVRVLKRLQSYNANIYPERIILEEETFSGPLAAHLKRYDFAKHFCANKVVLDAGCGVGYGLSYLGTVARQVTGIDISREAIYYAKGHYEREGIHFKVMDIHRLDFPDKYFDVICSFEVLEHLNDPSRFLSEVKRVLKEDGIFLVSTPQVKNTTSSPRNPYHKVEFSKKDFEGLLRKYFLDVKIYGEKRIQSIFHLFLQKIDIFRIRVILPTFLRKKICRILATKPWDEVDLGDFIISEEDLRRATWVMGVCRLPRPSSNHCLPVDVSVVIVSHNCKNYILECIESIFLLARPCQIEVIVVDNASCDGTAKAIRERFPNVSLIENNENRWFRAATNQGIRISQGRYVLLLNPDIRLLTPDGISKIIQYMDAHPKVGIVGAKLLYPDGKSQPDCERFPGLAWVFCHYFLIHKFWPTNPVKRYCQYNNWDEQDTRLVDSVSAACMMIRRDALEQIGLLDERCLIYWEEAELCRAAYKRGWQVLHFAQTEVLHHHGQGGVSINPPKTIEALIEQSMLFYYRKYYGVVIYWILLFISSLRKLISKLKIIK